MRVTLLLLYQSSTVNKSIYFLFQIEFVPNSPAPVLLRQPVVPRQQVSSEQEQEEDGTPLDKGCVTYVSNQLRRYLLLENAYPNGQEYDAKVDDTYKSWLEAKFLPIRECPAKQKKEVRLILYYHILTRTTPY